MANAEYLRLAETFAEVARSLLDEGDVDATLDRICALAVATVAGCESAGISLLLRGRVATRRSTDDLPRTIDAIQSETQQGPCADAIREHDVFRTGDLASEARWPDFSARAHRETGVTSVLSLRLYRRDETMGALNLYSSALDAFDDEDVAVGTVFAVHAAVALSAARREEQLEEKAEGRTVIGEAIGILMAREDVDEDRAFSMLTGASQRLNEKLRVVADRIVHPEPVG